jgi:UDP-glucose 4-epimerase
MKILVTGGAGFIGSHLVKALVDAGHKVIVADILLRGNKIEKEVFDKIEFHNADVRNENKMIELSKGCNLIIHFAAVLGVDVVADNPVETMDTEIIGTRNICKAALLNGIDQIMYASTSGVYGHSALDQTVVETINVDPRTSYAIAKRYNEIYLAALNQEKGLNSISIRFFNIYGPRQDNRMVIPRFIEQAENNEPITVYGSGNQTRDFTYVSDAVKACMLLMENIKGSEIYNIANENEISILELAESIKKIINSDSKVELVNSPSKRYDYEVGRRWGSSEKLFKKINYKPLTTLSEGLKTILGK